MNKHSMNRRTLLKGMSVGLGAVAASSMIPLNAMAATNTGRPQRFLTYYVPHGWPIELVDNFGSGPGWLNDSHVLSRLAPWQDKVAVLRGASVFEKAGHGTGHHVLNGGQGYGKETVDTTIAKHLGTRPWVGYTCSNDFFGRFNFENGANTQAFGLPSQLADQVFQGLESGSATAGLDSQFRKSLMALSESQLSRLASTVSELSSEQTRLSAHIESVREVKARADVDLSNIALNTDVGALKARQAHTASFNPTDQTKTTAILDGHLDVMAAGLTSGAVRVGTITIHGSGGNYIGNFPDGPGVEGNIHMNSHNGNYDHRINHYAKNLNWYLDRLTTLIQRLEIPDPLDPGRTVLDNTTILFTSELCDGSHVATAKEITIGNNKHFIYFPFVVIGGTAGKLKTGGVIETPVSHADIIQTFAHIHGTTFARGNVLNSIKA